MSASASVPASTGGPAQPAPPLGPPLTERGTVRHEQVLSQRWALQGIAKVVGEVTIGSGRLVGTVIVGGGVAAGELTLIGSLESRGSVVVAGRLHVRGSLDVAGGARSGQADLEGPVQVGKELQVDGRLRVRGSLRAPDVRCAAFELRGSAAVPGSITATSFDAHLVSDSRLGSVRCREFRLRGPAPNVVRRVLGGDPLVTVERVEADTARIESARVQFVRAREIVLGRGAHVVAIEGRLVRAHPSSRLGPESWSRPPEGLRR